MVRGISTIAARALFWEMGLGKTRAILEEAAQLAATGEISLLFVLAPNGVHRNWVLQEAPKYIPQDAYKAGYWASGGKAHERKALEAAAEADDVPLRIIAMNIEALSTTRGYDFAKKLADRNAAKGIMMVVDESSRIKSPSKKRSRACVTLGRRASYRRILTGTPITQSPLDLYSQFAFLHPSIINLRTYQLFKHRYAKWERKNTNNNRRGFYEALVGYQRMDELRAKILPFTHRRLKETCLDLPPKIYAPPREVKLSNEQRRIYDELVSISVAELRQDPRNAELRERAASQGASAEDELWMYARLASDGAGGSIVSAKNALTKLLRLQQVVGGFLAPDDSSDPMPIDGPNPRLDSMMELLEETGGRTIIWARFRPEIAAIVARLKAEYGEASVVEYHGGVNNFNRDLAKNAFLYDWDTAYKYADSPAPNHLRGQAPRFFVGQPHSGGIGIDLYTAHTVIYYSNDFSLEARRQSEDRAHRQGLKNSVTYVDMLAKGTIDERVAEVLLGKGIIADNFFEPAEETSA